MTYEAKITLKFDSTWDHTGGIYDDETLPEEHYTFEVPAQDLNATQLFTLFSNFARAIGHTEMGIMKGSCAVAFNDMRSQEDMRKVAEEYDLKLSEDYRDELCKLEAEVRDLKAKLSRLQQPDNPQYTDDEMTDLIPVDDEEEDEEGVGVEEVEPNTLPQEIRNDLRAQGNLTARFH